MVVWSDAVAKPVKIRYAFQSNPHAICTTSPLPATVRREESISVLLGGAFAQLLLQELQEVDIFSFVTPGAV